jgi:hypothetical protein
VGRILLQHVANREDTVHRSTRVFTNGRFIAHISERGVCIDRDSSVRLVGLYYRLSALKSFIQSVENGFVFILPYVDKYMEDLKD